MHSDCRTMLDVDYGLIVEDSDEDLNCLRGRLNALRLQASEICEHLRVLLNPERDRIIDERAQAIGVSRERWLEMENKGAQMMRQLGFSDGELYAIFIQMADLPDDQDRYVRLNYGRYIIQVDMGDYPETSD